jgi:hypothetical protein
MAVVVCAAGILILKVHLDQLDADMKTRAEMVYDFMVALAGNSGTHELVSSEMPEITALESQQAIYLIASNLADEYLKHLG